ncbi:MAG: hypothetical protein OES32_04395 [Acidobacteriota bacterium]|nr:hypothetical protein [Acidobacteriota bacterium]MDH3522804.1 hypothetical protein [Acidobacteriota bacterium]
MTRGSRVSRRSHVTAFALCWLLCCASGRAQEPEYAVRLLPLIPGSFSTIPSGFNNAGLVVGQTLVGSPLTLKAWFWTEATGTQLLPAPPGLSSYRAIDVNDAGVIVGDGGYDWGEAWRLADGVFEMLGTLPGDTMSNAAGINASGEVAGTSRQPSSSEPRNAFFAPVGAPMSLVQEDAWATYLNAAGQVVGYYVSNVAFRYTPGLGTETLPPLGDRVLTWAWSINGSGDVVGEAAQANGNGHVPFLFTDAAGMSEIGSFGGGAGAAAINDRGEVVGNLDAGGPHPWIWTEATGVRFLSELIDPASGAQLLAVARINQRGEILGQAVELATGAWLPVLLTPRVLFADGFESGDTSEWSATIP